MAALVFCAIMQCLMSVLGSTIGKFVAIILLMLQLCTAAGTFPIETCPPFFQVISPFLPMTYVVAGFKDIMCGASLAALPDCALALAVFGAVCFFLTVCVARMRRMVPMTQLHPLIDL